MSSLKVTVIAPPCLIVSAAAGVAAASWVAAGAGRCRSGRRRRRGFSRRLAGAAAGAACSFEACSSFFSPQAPSASSAATEAEIKRRLVFMSPLRLFFVGFDYFILLIRDRSAAP